jgi:hypothetical protein
MIHLDYDLIYTIIALIGGILLYLIMKVPSARKYAKLGILFSAYVRDIYALLIHKIMNDWKDLSISEVLDILKSLYDLIYSYDLMIHENNKLTDLKNPLLDNKLKRIMEKEKDEVS